MPQSNNNLSTVAVDGSNDGSGGEPKRTSTIHSALLAMQRLNDFMADKTPSLIASTTYPTVDASKERATSTIAALERLLPQQ